MTKVKQLYEGKAKKVWTTEDPELLIVDYKDDATAGNGAKKGTIAGKGVINNRMSNFMMKKLNEEYGVPTHFVEELSDRETLVKKCSIVPLEVIVRNMTAGSFSKRYGVEEGRELKCPIIEFCYKDDALGDPFCNSYDIIAMEWATKEEVETITDYTFKVNEFLKKYMMDNCNIIVVDFKVEFGRLSDGTIVLADEISPDTCRFWDKDTHEKLDKDRFRRDMGGEVDAYNEVMRRVMGD